MNSTDTIKLLKECDAGTKMAVSSINEVLDKVKSEDMRQLLIDSKEKHEMLGNQLHSMLIEGGSEDKEPAAIAKGMSWMKTNMKLGIDRSDATIADLITDGCDMGIKSLNKYKNQYTAADDKSRDLCTQLMYVEEQLCKELREYL